MKRDYEIHFDTGNESIPTAWDFMQTRDFGGIIVERGSFTGVGKMRGIAAVVEQMNLIGQYIPSAIKRMIETLSHNDATPSTA